MYIRIVSSENVTPRHWIIVKKLHRTFLQHQGVGLPGSSGIDYSEIQPLRGCPHAPSLYTRIEKLRFSNRLLLLNTFLLRRNKNEADNFEQKRKTATFNKKINGIDWVMERLLFTKV